MEFLEKDLEEIIFETKNSDLNERNLFISGKKLRQLRIGNYGIADIVTIQRCYNQNLLMDGLIRTQLDVTVYELKKDKIGISAFLQAVRYVKGIEQYLNKRGFGFDVCFKIVLIGRTIDFNSSFTFLESIIPENIDGTSFLDALTYSYDVKGLNFESHCNYVLTDNGFKL